MYSGFNTSGKGEVAHAVRNAFLPMRKKKA